MIMYPSTLPEPRLSGYTEALPDNMIKSQFNYGAEQTYRASIDTLKFTYSIVIPHHDLDIFENFYTSIYDGAQPFNTTWTIYDLANRICRFTSPPTITNLGGLQFKISAAMEVV